jgi:hypothetical protein
MMNNRLHKANRASLISRIPTVILLAILLVVGIAQAIPVASEGIVSPAGAPRLRQPQRTADYDAGVATAWFDLSLQLVTETAGFTPPVASRAFGYLGVTLYETVRPGMPGFRTLAGQLNSLRHLPQTRGWARYHWPSAANAALASMMRTLFPTATEENLRAIDALEAQFARRYQAEVSATTYHRSVAWGRMMANAIYTWSESDGGHEGYTRNFPDDYVAPVGPGLWKPTPPQYSVALQPYWAENRPFVLADGNACPSVPPPAYSEDPDSEFYVQAWEVYEVVREADPVHVEIARYWADDPGKTATPPGHWISILNQVLAQENASLATASEGYAKLGIAVADSFITCWHTKYLYNLMRPITYIQEVIDPAWNTPAVVDPVITPPFPEYTSGHSVQSGAAAAVLTDLFGVAYAFTDDTHAELGLAPRHFQSFQEAAQEAAVSRLYGGIHYRAAIENGLAQGECVGEKVLKLHFGGQ